LALAALGHQAQRLVKGLTVLQALSVLNRLLAAAAADKRLAQALPKHLADLAAVAAAVGVIPEHWRPGELPLHRVKAMQADRAAAAQGLAAAAAAGLAEQAAIGKQRLVAWQELAE
jgi:hypothetical protein